MKGFLYGQTEYNLLNNTIHLEDYIQKAKENSFTFLSITDKNLYGVYKFYKACKKHQITPVVGIEITYVDIDQYPSRMLAYCLNDIGYKNLIKLTTYLNTNPIPTSFGFLREYTEGLAFILVYEESIIKRLYTSNPNSNLVEQLKAYSDLKEFYVGYSKTNYLSVEDSIDEALQFLHLHQIKTLPLHNCRYLNPQDKIIYEALTKIGGSEIKVKNTEDFSFPTTPVLNSEVEQFIQKIHLNLFATKANLPKFPNTKGLTAEAFLKNLCGKGLYRRLKGKIPPIYQNRLLYELEVIHKMGYEDYFLIVWDFILYAKKNEILVGPGRGSAAGSLVAYCLGITEIDPLKYNLLFERFLNPERISMPDIDTDFPDIFRDQIISYVHQLYGHNHVCYISAFSTFLIRSAIRDLGRIQKIEGERLDEIIRLTEEASDFNALLRQFENREEIYNLLYIVKGLENLPRHITTHAAGIIISSDPLTDIVPLQEGINGVYQSQLEAHDLEEIGLLKMDFLGIRNLTILSDVIHQIPNFTMDTLRSIPLDDKKTYSLLASADTLGIFQLESTGIKRVLFHLKPTCFDDLVAVLALYRPGPMENIDEFIARRHGKKYSYLHSILEPILKSTYGIIVYQEQIMQIAERFAGFSLGQADLLRRAISKKQEDALKLMKRDFLIGAQRQGYSSTLANEIYDYILKFANYGFNKSHSVAYGLLVYQMAYLKANYFHIFISKILNNVIGSASTLFSYITYAKEHHVIVYKPNVNISTNIFEVRSVGIFMPLQAIKGIGEAITNTIVDERGTNGLFKDYRDFKSRTTLNSTILEALIFAGAFDCFGITKKQMMDEKEVYSDIFAKHLIDRIEDHTEYSFQELQRKEYEYLGFNLEYDVFNTIEEKHKSTKTTYIKQNIGKAVISFQHQHEIKTKKEEHMLVGELSDGKTTFDFVIFPSDYKKIKSIENNKLYLIDYSIRKDPKSNQNKLYIKSVIEC